MSSIMQVHFHHHLNNTLPFYIPWSCYASILLNFRLYAVCFWSD